MPVTFVDEKKRWRFFFNRVIGGVRHRATKLLPKGWSRTQAEKHDRQETGRLYAVATGAERPEPLIERAVELYLDHRLPNLRDRKGIAQELAFLAGYIEGRPMSDLSDVSREYAKDHTGLSPATVRNRLAYLRSACRYAWRKHKLTPHDPTGQMEFPQVDNVRDVRLPVDDYEDRILQRIIDMPTKALFTLAFYTGSRWPSEILPRQPADVYRTVVRGKARVLLAVGTTKNGSPRLIPVPPKARWALAYLPFKFCDNYYRDRFNVAREAAKLADIVPHAGRHIVATDILLRGGTLADVSAALHHKHWGSSARYAHLVVDHSERVLAEIGSKKMHTPRSHKSMRSKA